MHAVMDRLMRNRQAGFTAQTAPEYWLGNTFADRELTQAHLDEMILPALEQLAELEKIYGGGFKVLGVETRVEFPDVPLAYGTTDLLLGNGIMTAHGTSRHACLTRVVGRFRSKADSRDRFSG